MQCQEILGLRKTHGMEFILMVFIFQKIYRNTFTESENKNKI